MTCSHLCGDDKFLKPKNPNGRLLKPYQLFCSSKCEENYVKVIGLTPYPLLEAYKALLGAYNRLKRKDKDESK